MAPASSASVPGPLRGKRERLAEALDTLGALDRALWLRGRLGLPLLTVLTYHRVANDQDVGELDVGVIDARPEQFAQQVEILKQHCTLVTSADIVRFHRGRPLPPNPAMIAFDDGYEDCWSVALPVLTKAGVAATFFIPTAYPGAGKLFWWDRVSVMMRRCQKDRFEIDYPTRTVVAPRVDPAAATEALAHVVKNNPGIDLGRFFDELEAKSGVTLGAGEERRLAERTIMGFDRVRALRAAGMDVQSHSHSHRVLDTLTPEEARQDLRRSRELLGEVLDEPVEAVAYPVGYTLRGQYRRIAAESGFQVGFTNSSGMCRLDTFDPMSVSRVAMGTELVAPMHKLMLLLGSKPHRLHDANLRNFTGDDVGRPSRAVCSRRVIDDSAVLEQLTPAWRELCAVSAAASPTLSPEWLLPWWKVFGDERRRIRTLAIEQDGRLIGLAPLLARRHWYAPGVPFRRLESIGSGEDADDEVLSEYLGVLAAPGAETVVAEQLASALDQGELGAWDEVMLPLMDGSGAQARLVADALCARGIQTELKTRTEAPYIELPSTWDAYLAALPSQRRYFVNRSLRDFERWAGTDVEISRATDAASLQEGFSVLRSLHGERWSERRAGGAFGSARFEAFHRAVTSSMMEHGALDLSWLRVRGQPIAVLYSLVFGGKVHFYQAGRKVDLPPGIRAGIVLHVHAIRRAIDAGLREYDFLGGLRRYKTQLATAQRPLVELRAVRSSAMETLRVAGERGLDEARGLWRRVRPASAQAPTIG